MQANYVQRLRLRFSKEGATRFISHLDVARALERALNRAQLPLAYTQGYNPRPRMQFADALPLGFTSNCELADIWLEEEMDPAQAKAQMRRKMPPGLVVHEVWEAPLDAPAMQASTVEATYVATLTDLVSRTTLQWRVDALLAADSVERERRGKRYDLRPLVLSLETEEGDAGMLRLIMRLSLRPGEAGRPDEVLNALGIEPLDVHVQRTEIVLDDGVTGPA